MPRFDNEACTYREISFLTAGNCILHTVLDLTPKVLDIKLINSAVHVTIAIGRGYDGVVRKRKYVSTDYAYLRKQCKFLFPVSDQFRLLIYEKQLHFDLRGTEL